MKSPSIDLQTPTSCVHSPPSGVHRKTPNLKFNGPWHRLLQSLLILRLFPSSTSSQTKPPSTKFNCSLHTNNPTCTDAGKTTSNLSQDTSRHWDLLPQSFASLCWTHSAVSQQNQPEQQLQQ
ncbi:hypothetical protein PSTT_11661 [Puccinia striiformis]|uniref:Uncharacterized protein n=1 Tax=Puccinia striiformis TaxID=27350 RepID=A0A2S4UZE6_9BASI|nr:hypothetical protein PSTT_11661 [Puccinia striiformis]